MSTPPADAATVWRGRVSLAQFGRIGGLLLVAVMAAIVALTAPPVVVIVALIATCAIALVAISRRDAASVLMLLLMLLLLLPEKLVFAGPLKSMGYPAMVVGYLAGLLWIAGRVLDLIPANRRHVMHWLFFAFLFANAVAFAASAIRPLTAVESAGAIRAIPPVLAAVGIGLLANDALSTRRRLDNVLQFLVMVGAIAALIGMAEFAFNGFAYAQVVHIPGLVANGDLGVEVRSDFTRVAGAAAHPIEYAVVIAALLPLALHYATYSATRQGKQLFMVCAALLAGALPLTVSRSAMLAVGVAVLVYAVHWSRRARLNAVVLGIIGVGMYHAAVPGLIGTLRSLFLNAGTDPSISGRTEDYAHIPSLMSGHLLFGRGLGTFRPDQYFFLDNQYLLSLLEGGLLGIAVLIAVFVVGMGTARGARKRSTVASTRSLGQALTAGIAALAAAAATFDEFSFKQSFFLLFLFCGCAGALWTISKERAPREQPNTGSLVHV